MKMGNLRKAGSNLYTRLLTKLIQYRMKGGHCGGGHCS